MTKFKLHTLFPGVISKQNKSHTRSLINLEWCVMKPKPLTLGTHNKLRPSLGLWVTYVLGSKKLSDVVKMIVQKGWTHPPPEKHLAHWNKLLIKPSGRLGGQGGERNNIACLFHRIKAVKTNTSPKSISAYDTEDNLTVICSESEMVLVPRCKKAREMFLRVISSTVDTLFAFLQQS